MGSTASQECDRASRCLNFRLRHRPACSQCGVRITMSHFHATREAYRICDPCFRRHLPEILEGTYRPPIQIQGEVRACFHFERCFAEAPYSLYQPKLCDRCGRADIPQHYHDIGRNIRLCLDCCHAGLPEANSGRGAARGPQGAERG